MLHMLIEFCFDEGENNCVLLNCFGALWVKEKLE